MDELSKLTKEQLIAEIERLHKYYHIVIQSFLLRIEKLNKQIEQDDG